MEPKSQAETGFLRFNSLEVGTPIRMRTALSSRGPCSTYSKAPAACISEMSLSGISLPLVGWTITFFSTHPRCPFHICWQRAIFFPLLRILQGHPKSGALISMAGREIPLRKEFSAQQAPMEFRRSDGKWGHFECATPRLGKIRPCPEKALLSSAFRSLNVELLMLMTFWQFLVC